MEAVWDRKRLLFWWDESIRQSPQEIAVGVVILVLLVLTLAYAIIGPMFEKDEYRADANASSPAEQSSQAAPSPAALDSLEDFCANPDPPPEAAAYQGAGPHPYVVVEDETVTGSGFYAGDESGWDTDDTRDVQLVVCLDVSKVDGEFVTCEYEYEGEEFGQRHYATRYRFRVYAAATGELLDEKSERTDDLTCPYLARTDPDDPSGTDTLEILEDVEIHELLKRWTAVDAG